MRPNASSAATSPFDSPGFLPYLLARGCSEFAYQIATVAVARQIYALTGSAFALAFGGSRP